MSISSRTAVMQVEKSLRPLLLAGMELKDSRGYASERYLFAGYALGFGVWGFGVCGLRFGA